MALDPSSGGRASNPRPQAWEACALPTELPPQSAQILRGPSNLVRRETPHPADPRLARGRVPDRATALRPFAPDATRLLPVLGENAHRTLASLKGKVVVLNFWASWCEPCQIEAPLLEGAQSKLERHGATVLGVTFQDASPDSESFVRRYHLTYPIVRDTTGEFAHSFGTRQVPESFIINRRGRIVAIARGEIEQAFVKQALALAESS
jgi:cytochrome c biogenesis protein CcmG/thiol:disulfide interchange protein DsbE